MRLISGTHSGSDVKIDGNPGLCKNESVYGMILIIPQGIDYSLQLSILHHEECVMKVVTEMKGLDWSMTDQC